MAVLEPKDFLTLSISSFSLLVSLISFALIYRQRAIENRRAIRQSLTDAVNSLTEVSLAMAKLKIENPHAPPDVVSLRRTYNSSRRYLANHSELLMEQIPKLTTDIDHNVLAVAFDAIGDYERAGAHWNSCVEASPAGPLRAMNLRGLARFLFGQGKFDQGRGKFEESLRINLPDDDSSRGLRADTCAMWSAAERESGFTDEAERRRSQAIQEATRISHKRKQTDMLKYINDLSQ
jgi:tetratricopeptide (TPR) repeat protein